MKNIHIKYVKRAKSWCLTYFEVGKSKTIQVQKWFDTEEEAENYVKETTKNVRETTKKGTK